MQYQHVLRVATGLALFSSWMVQAEPLKKKIKTPEISPDSPAASVLFPDWSPESFDWSIGPIAGLRARQTVIDGARYDVASSELGIGARVQGIPLIPGNPGITVQPYGDYTWGYRTQKRKEASFSATENSRFKRNWFGLVGRFYYGAFRYSIDAGQGLVDFDNSIFTKILAQRIQNDFGFMILPFFSAHYTLTSLTVKEGNESKPSIDELDHWLHGRVSFSLLSFNLDLGPGMSRTEYGGRSAPELPFTTIGTATSLYVKALSSLHIFWKLGATASAKYIYHTDENFVLQDNLEQLPYEALAQRKSLALLPDGSLEATAFFGIKDLFAGFGFGWQYYYLERRADPKQFSRNQGFALVYNAGVP